MPGIVAVIHTFKETLNGTTYVLVTEGGAGKRLCGEI